MAITWEGTGPILEVVCILYRRLYVPLMEQKLLTLPEDPSSPQGISGVRVTRSLVLCIDRCLSFCAFSLAILLSVLLRCTDSDCPLGIFKLRVRMRKLILAV